MKATYLLVAALTLSSVASAQQVLKANLPPASAPAKSQFITSAKPRRTVVRARTMYRDRPMVATVSSYSFTDDFSSNKHDWNNAHYDWGSFTLANGKYTMQGLLQGSSIGCMPIALVDNNRDFTCSVATRWQEGITDYGFGIQFCGNGSRDSWYSFQIAAQGYFKVEYTDSQHTTAVALLPWTKSNFIYQNSLPNVLSVRRKGSFAHFFINDQEVGNIPFDGGYGNRFGLTVFNLQTVVFDNFFLTGIRKS